MPIKDLKFINVESESNNNNKTYYLRYRAKQGILQLTDPAYPMDPEPIDNMRCHIISCYTTKKDEDGTEVPLMKKGYQTEEEFPYLVIRFKNDDVIVSLSISSTDIWGKTFLNQLLNCNFGQEIKIEPIKFKDGNTKLAIFQNGKMVKSLYSDTPKAEEVLDQNGNPIKMGGKVVLSYTKIHAYTMQLATELSKKLAEYVPVLTQDPVVTDKNVDGVTFELEDDVDPIDIDMSMPF